ncbi:MAG: sulfatase-like hydrolase/transferase [Verrucomicrobiota bacterium]
MSTYYCQHLKQACFTLLAGLFVLLPPFLPAAAPAKPNILFFFTDDQRADTIAALGNPIIKTPNLDRLTREGLAFTRAYMQGGFNGATCVPSRAMLLSGRSLFHVDEKLLKSETWPAAFGRAGYTTFMSGKWHNGVPSLAKSFQIGRSVFSGGMTDPLKAKLSQLENGKLTPPQVATRHACQVFADEAIRFLKEHKGGPFLCYVPFDGPHDPHVVPEDFPVRYDPDKITLPPNVMPQHPFNNGEMAIRDEKLLPWPRPPGEVRAMIADYYRYVSYLDMLIGQVLETLKTSPFADNTIIVFSSDSGVARGSHGLIGKQNLYEHSLRVPLIMVGPGIPAGKRTDAMCYLLDVFPTLGALAGVPAPEGSEGIDLGAVLRDPEKPSRAQLVFAYQKVQRSIRDDRWKLIRYPQINQTQLFDLQNDPLETKDLAATPDNATTVQALMKRLEAALKDYGDDCPLTVENPKPAAWSPEQATKAERKKNR